RLHELGLTQLLALLKQVPQAKAVVARQNGKYCQTDPEGISPDQLGQFAFFFRVHGAGLVVVSALRFTLNSCLASRSRSTASCCPACAMRTTRFWAVFCNWRAWLNWLWVAATDRF